MTFKHEKITSGYFGKLPNFADFIKYNAAGDELLDFDKWIQEGILNSKSRFKDRWETVYKNSSQFNFLYNYQGGKNFLAGNIFPSKDKSRRDYPFLIILRFDKSLIAGDQLFLVPLLLKSFSNKMQEIYNFGVKCSNSAELNRFVENSEFDFEVINPVMNEYKEYLEQTELGSFLDCTAHESDDLKLIILNNLYLFTSIRNKQILNNGVHLPVSFSFRFPLLTGHHFLGSAFWINLFLNICRLNSNRLSQEIISLIWSYPVSGIQNNLYMIIGRLSAENFSELISPDYPGSNSINIINNYDKAGELNYLPQNLKTLMENKNLTLGDLLNSI